jgi:hypothetical protein
VSSAALVVIEGHVVDVARVDAARLDRPFWARVVRGVGVCGLVLCGMLAFVLLRRRHRPARGVAAGAVGGFLLGRRQAGASSYLWRLQTRDGPVIARMASGPRVDGLVANGDRIALRGRFAPAGVFHAYRGVNASVGLELAPAHLDAIILAGAAVAVWVALVATWII